MVYLAAFLIPLGMTLLTTPLAVTLSKRWGVMAQPGGRRRHSGRVPKLGGVPIIVGFLSGAAAIYWLLPPEPGSTDGQLLRGMLWGTLIVFGGGLLDDWFDLPPWAQFVFQFAGALIAFQSELFLERFTNPLTGLETSIRPFFFVGLLTFVWISGLMNTVNWLDGLDGLAAGVGTIAALLFAWHSYNLDQFTVAAFPLALAGTLLGFLPFNFSPAKIFLGSAGAYVLGYLIATLAILAPAKIATALLVLAVPILDLVWQIFDRLRRGRSPLRGDRGHLHFRLSDGGLPTRPIVFGYYAIAALFGLIAIFAKGDQKLIALIVLAMLVFLFLGWLTRQERKS